MRDPPHSILKVFSLVLGPKSVEKPLLKNGFPKNTSTVETGEDVMLCRERKS